MPAEPGIPPDNGDGTMAGTSAREQDKRRLQRAENQISISTLAVNRSLFASRGGAARISLPPPDVTALTPRMAARTTE
jgi:hypothetical protein